MTTTFYRFCVQDGVTYDKGAVPTEADAQMNVDGSVTPVRYKLRTLSALESRSGVQENGLLVRRAVIFVEDTGNFQASQFGALPQLTNGIDFAVYDDDDTIRSDLLGGIPIRSNAGWSRYMYDVQYLSFGSGSNYFVCRWTFERAGRPLRVSSDNYIGVQINDDLTGLDEFTVQFQGELQL